MAFEKKPFAWDTDVWVETVSVDDYTSKEIHVTSLKGKEFISFTTVKKIKEEWKPVGGFTIPKASWSRVVSAIAEFDAGLIGGATTDANGNVTEVKPKGTKKPKAGAK